MSKLEQIDLSGFVANSLSAFGSTRGHRFGSCRWGVSAVVQRVTRRPGVRLARSTTSLRCRHRPSAVEHRETPLGRAVDPDLGLHVGVAVPIGSTPRSKWTPWS